MKTFALSLLLFCIIITSAFAQDSDLLDNTVHRSTYAAGVPRDNNGHIKRSSSARRDFMKQTGYPTGRPGYVVDHIIPLKRCGNDDPSNMQWQTREDAKQKDKWE